MFDAMGKLMRTALFVFAAVKVRVIDP